MTLIPDSNPVMERTFKPHGLIAFFYGKNEKDIALRSLLNPIKQADLTKYLTHFTQDDAEAIYACNSSYEIQRVVEEILHRIQGEKGYHHHTSKIQRKVTTSVTQQLCALTSPKKK